MISINVDFNNSRPIKLSDVVKIQGHSYYCAEMENRRGTEWIEFELIVPRDDVPLKIVLRWKPVYGLQGDMIPANIFFDTIRGWRILK